MERNGLLQLLHHHGVRFPEDRGRVEEMRGFVVSRPDCFERGCPPGHVTASAWIVSADLQRSLLTLHRKLGRWLQLGGHVDGSSDVFGAAVREGEEESGFVGLQPSRVLGSETLLDVDIHPIPAHGGEPEHLHYDVRFLLVAPPSAAIVRSDESDDLRWFEWSEVLAIAAEPSLRRMAERARRLLENEHHG